MRLPGLEVRATPCWVSECVSVCKPYLLGKCWVQHAFVNIDTKNLELLIERAATFPLVWRWPAPLDQSEDISRLCSSSIPPEGGAFTALLKKCNRTFVSPSSLVFGSFKFTLPNYMWTGACKQKSDGLTSSLFMVKSFGNLSCRHSSSLRFNKALGTYLCRLTCISIAGLHTQ